MSPAREPLVVIVTPVYDGARYLPEALGSVEAQTWPNLLHLVLDNASNDATPEILARAQRAPRRRPLLVRRNTRTLPIMENWSAAFARAPKHAAFVRLLCADDWIEPDAIERSVRLAASDPEVACVLTANALPDGRTQDWGWPKDRAIFDGAAMAAAFLRSKICLMPPHAMVRADLLAKRDPFFQNGLLSGDMDAILWAMRQGKVGFVHAPVSHTREHGESVSATAMWRDFLHLPEWLVLLERHGPAVLDPDALAGIRRGVRRAYLRRVLKWRWSGRRALVAKHMALLRAHALAPRLGDFADAVFDWPLKAAGLREYWTAWPTHD